MPFQSFFKSIFLKTFHALSRKEQTLITGALEGVRSYLMTGEAPFGLRIKKIHEQGRLKVFEARASADLRVIWVQENEEITFSLIGNHEDARRFIKNF